MSPRSCTSPQPSTPKIESTASRGAVVTSSPTGFMSTRQPGGKHSITKRFTRESCREVRLAFMARPHGVEAYRLVSSCLLARGLIGHFDKESTQPRSWLKTNGRVCGNQSFYRRTTREVRSLQCAPSAGRDVGKVVRREASRAAASRPADRVGRRTSGGFRMASGRADGAGAGTGPRGRDPGAVPVGAERSPGPRGGGAGAWARGRRNRATRGCRTAAGGAATSVYRATGIAIRGGLGHAP